MPDQSTRDQAILRMLGLAKRAGYLAEGMDAVRASLRRRQAKLVLLAGDAGDSTRSTICRDAARCDVEVLEIADRIGIGRALGRRSTAVIAVEHAPMARGIRERFGGDPTH